MKPKTRTTLFHLAGTCFTELLQTFQDLFSPDHLRSVPMELCKALAHAFQFSRIEMQVFYKALLIQTLPFQVLVGLDLSVNSIFD